MESRDELLGWLRNQNQLVHELVACRIVLRSTPFLLDRAVGITQLENAALQALRRLLLVWSETFSQDDELMAMLQALNKKDAFIFKSNAGVPFEFRKVALASDWAVRCSRASDTSTAGKPTLPMRIVLTHLPITWMVTGNLPPSELPRTRMQRLNSRN